CATPRLDYPTWTKIGPGEFLFARPHQLHWFSRCLGQTRSLNRTLPSMLATISRARIGHHHPDLLRRNVESSGQFIAHGERTLRACPDGKLLSTPLSDCSARFERRMSDVLDGVSCRELDISRSKRLFDRPG